MAPSDPVRLVDKYGNLITADNPLPVTAMGGDPDNPEVVQLAPSAAAVVTEVAASITNVTLLAANPDRRGATVHNGSAAALYLKLGATAAASSYTVRMAPDSYYEVPFGYNGRIDGIWASADGAAKVTELT